MKKLLSVFLSVLLLSQCIVLGSTAFTVGAETSGDYTYIIVGNEAIITDVDTSISGDITIPQKFGDYTVTTIYKSAFQYCRNITSLTICDNITYIGYGAFDSCFGLKNVTLGNNVTTIYDSAFFNCTKLESIIIPDSVTYIGGYAFESCTSLNDISIPDSVTYIGSNAFSSTAYYNNSDNWENDVLYIDNHLVAANPSISGICEIKPGTLTVAAYSFSDITELKTVIIPDSVTNICCDAFAYCAELENVTFGNGIKSIEKNAFSHCWNLKNITLPDSITDIGTGTFENTGYFNDENNWDNGVLYINNHLIKANTEISDTYNIKDGTLTIAGGAFEYCHALTGVNFPESVISIGDAAFSGCYMKALNIPAGVTNISENAFVYCSSLITVNENNGSYSSEDGVLFNKDKTKLLTYPLHDERTSYTVPSSVTYIADSAFSGSDNLESINLSDNLTHIGSNAFYNCEKLKSITIPDGVTIIKDYVFDSCNSLESVTLGNKTAILGENSFSNCYTLKEINIPDSVYFIENSAFSYCKSLKTVTIGENVTKIGDIAFEFCNLLEKIVIPDSVTSIGSRSFSNCTNLKSVTFGKGVSEIGGYAFYACNSLGNANIPDSVTLIGESAFRNCVNLESAIIGSGVKKINRYVFAGCNNIRKIIVGNSVEQIEDYAFKDCSNSVDTLTVFIPKSTTIISPKCFENCSKVKVYCVGGSHAEYYCNQYNVNYETVCGCVNGEIVKTHSYTNACDTTCNVCGAERTAGGHKYDNACDKTCNICGATRTVSGHKYSNACDETCNNCGAKRTVSHTYKTTTTKATLTKNGSTTKKCTVCGKVASTTTIYYPKTVKIAATTYTYTGKVITPAVTVKNSKGTALKKGTDYTVTYASGRKNVGKYKVTVTFKGNYSGTKTFYFTINPVKTTVSKLTAGKKSIKVAISKKSTQVTGYQIQYSTSKTFKSAKTVTLKSYKTTSVNLTKLSAKKTYYVRVRTYKTVGKTKYYSAWSTYKYTKTK